MIMNTERRFTKSCVPLLACKECLFDRPKSTAGQPSSGNRARLVGSAIVAAFFLSVSSALAQDCPPKPEIGKDASAKPNVCVTIWTTGSALMPGWGLYPNGQEYDGTKPLGIHAAWRRGRLTWVVEFPSDGTYEVYVRSFREGTLVTIDEGPPVRGGKSRGRNNF